MSKLPRIITLTKSDKLIFLITEFDHFKTNKTIR